MLEMDPAIRARWTAKLRSNEFIQGTSWLSYDDIHDDNRRKNCCMGVLCEMAVEDGIVTSENIDGTIFYAGEDRLLPEEVRVWAGLDASDPALRRYEAGDVHYELDPDEMVTCSRANDDEGMTFPQIADLIDGGVDASS